MKIGRSTVIGHAQNYRGVLPLIWDQIESALLQAENEEDVVKAFKIAQVGGSEFPALAPVILRVMKDPNFPKRRQARINFLADSIAGVGLVTPRRARDICAEDRFSKKETQRADRILRYEYYVECSCGYQGPSRDHACRNCGAKILNRPFDVAELF